MVLKDRCVASRNVPMLQILSVERLRRMSRHCSWRLRSSSKGRNVIPNLEDLKLCCAAPEGSAREMRFRRADPRKSGNRRWHQAAARRSTPITRPLVAHAASCPARLPSKGPSTCTRACEDRRRAPSPQAFAVRTTLSPLERSWRRRIGRRFRRRLAPDFGQPGSGNVTTP